MVSVRYERETIQNSLACQGQACNGGPIDSIATLVQKDRIVSITVTTDEQFKNFFADSATHRQQDKMSASKDSEYTSHSLRSKVVNFARKSCRIEKAEWDSSLTRNINLV